MPSTYGPHLYQSTTELQTLDLISTTAASIFPDPSALLSPLLPSHYTLRDPIDRPAVIAQLNSGILNRLLHHFRHAHDDLAVVLLGTVAMELGVRFQREDVLVLKMCVMRGVGETGGILSEGSRREEVVGGVEEYDFRGGRGWVFWRMEGKMGKGDMELKEMRRVIEEVEKEMEGAAKASPAQGAKHADPYADPHAKPSSSKTPRTPRGKAHRASWFPSPIAKSQHSSLSSQEDGKASRPSEARESMYTLPIRGRGNGGEQDDVLVEGESCYRLPCPSAKPMTKGKGKAKENRRKEDRMSI